ncbi:hypothetical protein J3Q64DRAFT_1731715 [Phycomyces blakesleeanus]|uniref:Uncharacterized protein n=2 Tax=Phycomyces blakesleeanus TaxID=4837 RepID=A0A163DZY0_PHYB8|nr:hypothetical protein PHYBLDRAFT_78838 [Phycomyces blakesleeanus NRRL 1555(-)]OAD74470.1 hypothetical protein PHYBLDRAFT_78838 [Phycomyces blakesleeanus NRRL 1555(-)]|eukprot:XP_018292510.1 hypothetical protein PHYBLDRAFT_78838 [Phycomyces blakesleeanus NRRL 1555(-)]
MYFIREAFYKRPFESARFAAARGVVAVLFVLLFFAYCAYLIVQIVDDVPLILLSSESVNATYAAPDIEMCVVNTTMQFAFCNAIYTNFTSLPFDCIGMTERGAISMGSTPQCYMLRTQGLLQYAANRPYPENSSLINNIEILWKLGSVDSAGYNIRAQPSMDIQLYSPTFNQWYLNSSEFIPQERTLYTSMQNGNNRIYSNLNVSTIIKFSPVKYRAIKPKDSRSILGFGAKYVDIITLDTTQQDFPLQQKEPLTTGGYDGIFSISLAKTNMDVKTEQRQYTVLNAIALAGGAYGVLTGIYTILFGAGRFSPWGIFEMGVVYNPFAKSTEPAARPGKGRPKRQSSILKARISKGPQSMPFPKEHDIQGFAPAASAPLSASQRASMENDTYNRLLGIPFPQIPSTGGGGAVGDPVTHYDHDRLKRRMDEMEAMLRTYFIDAEPYDVLRQGYVKEQLARDALNFSPSIEINSQQHQPMLSTRRNPLNTHNSSTIVAEPLDHK